MSDRYTRDGFTWLQFLTMAVFGYALLSLGPIMSPLGKDLHLSMALQGFHMSCYALGALLAGFLVPSLLRRWGRKQLFMAAGFGMLLALVLLSLAFVLAMSLGAFFLLGLMASILISLVQSLVADRHGPHQGIALAEGNLVASVSQVLPPLVLGATVMLGVSWTWVLLILLPLGLLVLLLLSRQTFPAPVQTQATTSRHLPGRYWRAWLLLACLVCVEWVYNFWGLRYLMDRGALDAASAGFWFGGYALAYVVGRLAGAVLLRRWPAWRILPGVLIFILLAFLLFWLSTDRAWLIVGLALSGFGVANVYPLGLAIALDSAPGQSDLASARTLWAVGGGLLVAPFLLGWLGDLLPLFTAFGIELVFLALAAVSLLWWRKSSLRTFDANKGKEHV